MTDRTNEEIIENIKHILDEKVAPSVAAHNGKINFMFFIFKYIGFRRNKYCFFNGGNKQYTTYS